MSTSSWTNDAAQLAKMKILIVDDEPVNVALLEEILVENEFTRFASVTDSKCAVDTCREFQPDLVLLDLMMPAPDGFAILESIRAYSGETFLPIVILTADTNDESKRRALEAGATDFLLKPFDHVEVALRIRNLLKSRLAHLLLDLQRAALEDAVCQRTAELRATIAQLEARTQLLATDS
ncbi:MAG: two-component system response regulator [Verrucomicrobia bacterium]|nr:MAG: two-component system response regulator [Verrucomicrobiota bacterium]